MIQQWTKAELEAWCLGWCRTPHTTLKAFIDAGFCSDQTPSREEMRLLHQPTPSTVDATKPVMPDLEAAIARLNRSTWDNRTLPIREDVRALLDAYRAAAWPEPPKGKRTWYRGWETVWDGTAAQWTGEGWYACFGGEDLDAITVRGRTWEGLLDEIDDHAMTEDAA